MVLGTRAAETILASDYMWSHPKAVHIEASNPIKIICSTSCKREPSTCETGSGPCSPATSAGNG
jgi:hypothetical protein